MGFLMKFSHLLIIAVLFVFAALLVPQPEHRTFASSCSGSSEPTVARKTPARDFLAKQPVRKTLSVLKPAKKSCSGE